MQINRFKGIFPPVTTPFDEAGHVDLAALGGNIDRYNETKLTGYVPLGSNSETVHLSSAERVKVVETVRRRAAADKIVIGGVNELSTESAIEACKRVADAGADAALVITPYFYKGSMNHAAFTAHYTDVADHSPVPVFLYHVPQNTGVSIDPATIAGLAAHENIIGIKDSSGDMGALLATLRLSPKDFLVLTGNGGILCPSVMMGAAGAVLAIACLIPEICVDLYKAASSGDHDRARELQDRISPLSALVTTAYGVPGLKAALNLTGYNGGFPKRPLLPVSIDDIEKIRTALRSSGLVAVNR